ncbi:MAG: hypothetical protein M0R80_07925 [Proteobacteria bacterium]|jgi:hypothetical protein|nr:hypothetical protein [Pseudomonadota bacterium]
MDIKKMFWETISVAIDADGVYPHQMIIVDKDDKMTMCAMDVDYKQILIHAFKEIALRNCKELIFGVDRTTREGQGTEFSEVLTCAHWKDGVWTIGVINYQNEPRIVRDWDWDNEFWNREMLREITDMEKVSQDICKGMEKIIKSSFQDRKITRPEIDPIKLEKWEQDYNKWVKENGVGDDFVKEIFFAGNWLGEELESLGAASEMIEKLCFVHGQRSFLGDPWGSAAKVIADYKNGQVEEPGEELAEKITMELFTSSVSEV